VPGMSSREKSGEVVALWPTTMKVRIGLGERSGDTCLFRSKRIGSKKNMYSLTKSSFRSMIFHMLDMDGPVNPGRG
jgi:hypothetical protein